MAAVNDVVPLARVASRVHPSVSGCLDGRDRSACLAVAEGPVDDALTASALERACRLGSDDACVRFASDPELAARISENAWEEGCRRGAPGVCAAWLDVVDEPRRLQLRDALCAAGRIPDCGSPTVSTPEMSAVSGQVVRGGVPVEGVDVKDFLSWSRTDRKGRYSVITGDEVVLRETGRPYHAAPSVDGAVVDLPEERWIRGTAAENITDFTLTGCGDRRVAVQADGRFFAPIDEGECRVVEPRLRLQLAPPPDVGEYRVENVLPEVPAMRVHGPDGRPLGDARLGFGHTGSDGALVEVHGDEEPCTEGAIGYEGYLAVCQLFQWPVHVQADGPVLMRGHRTQVVGPGWTGLEPGRWEALAVDGGPSVPFHVGGPEAVVVPSDGSRPLQVVDAAGWPVIADVETAAGPMKTDAWGRLPAAADGPLVVAGRSVGRPRDGVIVLDEVPADSPITWTQRPLGLVAASVDEQRVELFPGDVLRVACGADVVGLDAAELRTFIGDRTCPARVWRNGEVRDVGLPRL